MCYPRAPTPPCQEVDISKKKWGTGLFSPTQMWRALRQITLNKTSHIRSVTGKASQKVRRVRRWVFNFTFSKIVIPILILGFLLILSPYKDIQVGVTAGFIIFFFVFGINSREDQDEGKNYLHSSLTSNISSEADDVLVPHPSLLIRLYSLFPLSRTSQLWGILTTKELPRPFNIFSVWLYATITGCKRDEAEFSDLSSYKTISQFFTRKLAPGLRPISSESDLVSPCDGTVTYVGVVDGPYLQQVKGVQYSFRVFLGRLDNVNEDPGKYYSKTEESSERVEQDDFSSKQIQTPSFSPLSSLLLSTSPTRLYQTVIYLSPSDYHRFHSPASWTVIKRRHFPGKLYSVAPAVVKRIPGLFHTNERVAFIGRWAHGFFAMVAVGATNVGSIKVHFDQELSTNLKTTDESVTEKIYNDPIKFNKGDEFGYFNFGSTIVLIYEAPVDTIIDNEQMRRVEMGQRMWI
eukprot:TRINITY_DN3385_c0_g1_i3.p1 TRINITY_DN3385_c0_g1~~TRINITY_DN3385_c0_g1_i3.p1  ORF type:complete len:462 (-),score=63.60 TRINITY_DN3385_c0_g1_i3:276-1661(-)